MCHPGHVDDELKRLDPLTTLREKEYAYFCGDAFPADLAAARRDAELKRRPPATTFHRRAIPPGLWGAPYQPRPRTGPQEDDMTPQERQLMAELFDRLASLENSPRDPDAEAMIREGFRRAPNAAYALVQTVLLQDEALKAANAHIQEYEQRHGAPQPQPEQPRGFLDNMRDSVFGRDEPRGSVPRVPQGGRADGCAPIRGAPQGVRAAAAISRAAISRGLSAGRADAGASATGRWRLVPRHRGRGRGRPDRRLAADGRHPLGDGRASAARARPRGAFDSLSAAAMARRERQCRQQRSRARRRARRYR